jgi:hypothetical protein
MEPKNRNVLIIVIVVLAIACCCVLALAVGAAVWLRSDYVDLGDGSLDLSGNYDERLEESFAVGGAPTLEITNFAGKITVRAGEPGTIRVVATKKASSRSRLGRIEVDMNGRSGGLVIKTRKSFNNGNASVDLEITMPADGRMSINTGAGEVAVRDMTGRIEIHSGAGEVDVRGAQDAVQVDLGAGQITYEGVPGGDCRFQTGAGEIVLRLPEEPHVRIDVGTGLGGVDVDFDVDGRVSPRSVKGVIGDGRQGSVFAHTGVGSVSVRP